MYKRVAYKSEPLQWEPHKLLLSGFLLLISY